MPERISLLFFLSLAIVPSAHAYDIGTYRCYSYNVSGGSGNCRLAAPIQLNADATYQESRTKGTYKVVGDSITFSESRIRGPGKFVADNKIMFRYKYKNMEHTVTYLCSVDCRASATPQK